MATVAVEFVRNDCRGGANAASDRARVRFPEDEQTIEFDQEGLRLGRGEIDKASWVANWGISD
jgi:hypothetical protein